jgi:AcrR family transcriptional regulator
MVLKTPKKRPSADQTRAKILKVAQKLFAKKGYAATSISNIAEQAKINQSLIYHHFTDKKSLWRYAKHDLLENYAVYNELKAFDELAENDFKSFLQQILTLRFNFYQKYPDIVRLLNWQRLDPDKKDLQTTCWAAPEQWLRAIKEFQRRGEMRTDLLPEIAMNLMWNAATGYYVDHFPQFEQADQKTRSDYLALTIDCVYRALANINYETY